MKPKFELKLKLRSSNSKSKAEATVARKMKVNKDRQLKEAVQYCLDNNVRGHSALKTGRFHLIKDRETINRRLDGQVITGEERSYCTILTPDEEEVVVNYVKNKNRAMQGINKAQLTKLILDVLRIRDYTNKTLKGGRKFIKLSANAKEALRKGKLSRSFWTRFHATHRGLRV